MKNSFVLTSALVFIFSVSAFGFYKFIHTEKVDVSNLSATIVTDTSQSETIKSTTIYYPDGNTIQAPSSIPTTGQNQNYTQTNSFTGSAGLNQQNTNTTVSAPSSVSFLDRIIPLNSFAESLNNNPLNKIFNQLFYLGLIVAVVLAVIMIIRGGIEYMTIDAIASKESGKKRVQAALGGLLLAFSAVLILNTINPNITSLKIVFPTLSGVSEVEVEAIILKNVNTYSPLTSSQFVQLQTNGKIPEGISPSAQKILAEALNSVGVLKTGAIPGTDAGNKACAAAVNKIVQSATGQAVGGGLSTSSMYDALQTSARFQLIPNGISEAQPGDIIISPTESGKVGHVGIVATQGATTIISNSSSAAEVRSHFSANSWNRVYGGKGLPVYIYRPL